MKMLRWLPLLCVVQVSCSDAEERPDTMAADSLAERENALRTATLLAPVRAVGAAVTEFGSVAAQRATRVDVRGYAQVVTADHRAVMSTLDSIVQTLSVTYEESTAARDLEEAVRMAHAGLETLDSTDFDLAFIRAEVESHRLLLDRLDQELIPEMRGAELRALLVQVRAMTDAHLTRARQLLATLLGQPTTRPAAPRPRPDTLRPRPPVDTLPRS